MPVKVTAWKCEHCNMTSVYKSNVKRHERRTCQKAPGACATCKFFAVRGARIICNLAVKRTQCQFWQASEVTE